jgi:hypothetical protein
MFLQPVHETTVSHTKAFSPKLSLRKQNAPAPLLAALRGFALNSINAEGRNPDFPSTGWRKYHFVAFLPKAFALQATVEAL